MAKRADHVHQTPNLRATRRAAYATILAKSGRVQLPILALYLPRRALGSEVGRSRVLRAGQIWYAGRMSSEWPM